MKCEQCGIEYEAKRSTSKYCSAKCRKLAFHPNGKVSVPELSVPVPVDRARLVPIPGDPDYVGCCKLVAGDWQVDNTKPDVKVMPTDELVRRLHYIKDWQRSPEHQEVLRRRREAAA